jgi:hypothetical protein
VQGLPQIKIPFTKDTVHPPTPNMTFFDFSKNVPVAFDSTLSPIQHTRDYKIKNKFNNLQKNKINKTR